MKNAKIHFSKFEIYMAQSIHGLKAIPNGVQKDYSFTQ